MSDMAPKYFGPWQTLFDAVSKLILRVKRDGLGIYFLLRTIIFSIISVHWGEEVELFGKKSEHFCQICILRVQRKNSSIFFSKEVSFLRFLTISENFHGKNFSAEFFENCTFDSQKKSMIQNKLRLKKISIFFEHWAKFCRFDQNILASIP